MARDKRSIPPTHLTRKWNKQDVNHISELEHHGVRLPNDFVDWSTLSGNVDIYKLTTKELEAYNGKQKS